MNLHVDSPHHLDPQLLRPPSWATPRAAVESDIEAAYMAGGALAALDSVVRMQAEWAGAWRQRLALKAAANSLKLAGRTEDEAALRDVLHLRQPGDEAGPAGNVVTAWRRLVTRSDHLDETSLTAIGEFLGAPAFGPELLELVGEGVQSTLPAPLSAAAVAASVVRRHPDAELLAWWVADLVLALRTRWTLPVPVLTTQMFAPLLRSGPGRRRVRPGDAEFGRALCIAAAAGAVEACNLALAIAPRAQRLLDIAPKLRSSGSDHVIRLLLDDDAVSGSLRTQHLSRWSSRRLFDRLVALGAVRELSGRDTFRLYGL